MADETQWNEISKQRRRLSEIVETSTAETSAAESRRGVEVLEVSLAVMMWTTDAVRRKLPDDSVDSMVSRIQTALMDARNQTSGQEHLLLSLAATGFGATQARLRPGVVKTESAVRSPTAMCLPFPPSTATAGGRRPWTASVRPLSPMATRASRPQREGFADGRTVRCSGDSVDVFVV